MASNTIENISKIAIKVGNFIGITPMSWDKKSKKMIIIKSPKFKRKSYTSFSFMLIYLAFLIYQLWKYKNSAVDNGMILVYFVFTSVAMLGIYLLMFEPHESVGIMNGFSMYLENFSGKKILNF